MSINGKAWKIKLRKLLRIGQKREDYKICRVEREKGGEDIFKGIITFPELKDTILKNERVYI